MSSLAGVKLHLIESIDDVLRFNEWLGERRPNHALAFDTETTGLKIGRDVVRLVQVGDGMHGWAMPWTNEVGANGNFLGGWAGLFADTVRRWDGRWIAHNAKYDVPMLSHMRVEMPKSRVDCTYVMTKCLSPQYSAGLKPTATRLIDATAGQAQSALDVTLAQRNGWDWATVPVDLQQYWSYAALDTVLAWRLDDLLRPQVEADCPRAYEIEMAVTWVIERMERYGAHIDVAYAREKWAAFEAYVASSAQWCKTEYGVSPGSNAAVIEVLQAAGYEFTKRTDGGSLALDKEVLLSMCDHPLAATVLQRRRLQKLASTYLRHFVEDVDENDLIHPSINVLGARTSRMSMEDPNLQNLPRKSEVNPAADTVRHSVTTRYGRDGAMVMADFDQVEMRGLASMANEHSMIEAFEGTEDFFVALAKLVYQDDAIVKADPRRQTVKNAGYATIYGAGVEKFSRTAGISLDQGQWVRARWNELFPGVVRFQQEIQRLALQRRAAEGVPYVRCPLTRRRQVADPGKEYALVNYLIQGWAGALFKQKLIELDDAGLGEWMVAPVHDEIVLDVPNEHVAEVAETLRKVMNDDTIVTVPITASVSWGPSWGSKEAYVDPLDDKCVGPDSAYRERSSTRGSVKAWD